MCIARFVVGPSVSVLALATLTSTTSAGVIGFNEWFGTGHANWRGATSATVLAWTNGSGPGGSSYVTSSHNLSATQTGGFPQTVIRATASAGSSGLGYAGNWASESVTGVSFWFRHNLTEAISLTLRVASPQNYPAASAFDGQSIAANTWTQVQFDLRHIGGEWVSFEGTSYGVALSNVGNMQVGFVVPISVAGSNFTGHFDMTGFTVVPSPGAFALIGLSCFFARRRR